MGMRVRSTLRLALALTVLIAGAASCRQETPRMADLETTFSAAPPPSAYPWVIWNWMDGMITKEGIRKDLLWMNSIGISGVQQFETGGRPITQVVDRKVDYMSDEWKEDFRYAMFLADSLGIEVALESTPGWSHTGGPWVKPKDGMKKLVWRTVEVTGGTDSTLVLPEPFKMPGKFQDLGGVPDVEPWYQDVAVVAVRIPENDRSLQELGAVVSSSEGAFTVDLLTDGKMKTCEQVRPEPGGYSWVRYDFPEPRTFRSVRVSAENVRLHRVPGHTDYILECSDDGKEFREVVRMRRNKTYSITDDFPAETARCWRLKIYPAYQEQAAPRKQSIREFVLSEITRVNHAEEKAGFAVHRDVMDFPTPESPDAISDVVVLDGPIRADGSIACSLPEGRWRVYRFGQSLTGKKNHPIQKDAVGLEVDKLDPDAWMDYFRTYLGKYKEVCGDLMGKRGLRYLHTDSFEAGNMNWTTHMTEEFARRNGYDLRRWLPALTGEILDSSEETEKFLWDWRKTLADLLVENFDRQDILVREFGLAGRSAETHENGRGFFGDGMDIKMGTTIPEGAIWMRNTPTAPTIHSMVQHEADMRETSSVAHIYGQNLAALEAFTTSGQQGRAYSYCPENIKWTADRALSSGINKFVIHESAHQPADEKVPGTGLFQFGLWFNRHETWAGMARPWMDYLARSSYLLQQGKYVADILLYYGEDNCITGLYGTAPPEIPMGYSFDYINPKGLLSAVKARGGKLVTDSGMSYEVLVLGKNCRRMSTPMLRRIIELASKGVTVCGTLPEIPAGRKDDDDAFADLSSKLAGMMTPGSLAKVLAGKGITPDCTVPSDDIRFVHRRLCGADFYWVRNFGEEVVSAELALRTPGGNRLEIWDPENGKRYEAETYDVTPDGIRTTLEMAPECALFLVVKKDGQAAPKKPAPPTRSLSVEGPWQVAFQEGRGAPAEAIFEHLGDWSLSEDPGIRYFSGVAGYSTTLTLEEVPDGPCILQLGDVKNLAEVSVNGVPCGIAWKAPFTVDIPEGALRKGENRLEIRVANLWVNRIIGDRQPDCTEPITTTPIPFYKASDPLLPSGLLGPVEIRF